MTHAMRILIVDDNTEMRSIMRALIVHSGDQIRECSSSEEAIAQFGAFHPDVVLMDIQMSGVSGIAATRVIKQQAPDIRVIVVTNFADEQSRRAALQAGADTLLSKEELITLPKLLRRPAGTEGPE